MVKIPFGRPLIGEEERSSVMRVLEGNILVHGPAALEFERAFAEFTGAPEAVSVSSCTAGMHLVYFAYGFGKGDEVIVPAQTHVATAHAVELVGATPIFVDSEIETGNLLISAIEASITDCTRAIVVVHYLGVPVDMLKVSDIAKRHGLYLIEDCALACGAKVNGTHVGLFGDAGVFSFYPVKHITTAEGGMIVLRDKEMAKRLQYLKAFGVDKTHHERDLPGKYDVLELGFNYRMSEVHAAIGIEQVRKIPKFLAQRRANFTTLEKILRGQNGYRLLAHPTNGYLQASWYCMGVLLEDRVVEKRAEIMTMLADRGIGTSIYYPQPVPRMEHYRKKYGYEEQKYTNAARISDNMIALPVGPHLDVATMEIIGEEFKSVLRELA